MDVYAGIEERDVFAPYIYMLVFSCKNYRQEKSVIVQYKNLLVCYRYVC